MTPATFEAETLTISAGDFRAQHTVRSIERNWDALSHSPDRRARMELGALGERLNAFAEHVEAIAAKGGAIDAPAEIEQFVRRHVSLTQRAWAMESRCMSSMIVGPARFPVERNRKRQASADKAFDIVRDHPPAARKAVERRAWPHGAPGDAIRASNPDAPDLLRARIEERKRSHAIMKAANAAIRAVKGEDIEAMVQAVVDATGWRQAMAREIVCPREAWMGRGFASYQLSGELAEIKRLEVRLERIEAQRERGAVERQHNTAAGAVTVTENPDAARIQLRFPGKPDDATRDLLKRNGFRWSPREEAWQRHLNEGGRWAAGRVISALQPEGPPTVASPPAAPADTAPTEYRAMGRVFDVTAAFRSDDEANAYMASHPGEGVIACERGWVLIASKLDEGR